jgi:antitoxin component YwqK of YwqJK toxin-antitoxin module
MNKLINLLIAIFVFSSFFAQENMVDAKGKKQGYWKKYFTNTLVLDYEGNFKDDLPEGSFIYYFKNGKVKAKMNFKDAGKVCYSTIFHEDEYNLPMASGKYVNQIKDSVWKYWGPSGKLSMMESYKLGILDGKKIVYYVPELIEDKSILVSQELFYKDGKKNGEQKEFFDNGVLKCKSNYIDDKKVGIEITNNPNGIMAMKDNYVNGVKEGWCYAYDENGLEISKVYFKSGVRLDEKQTKILLEKMKNKK